MAFVKLQSPPREFDTEISRSVIPMPLCQPVSANISLPQPFYTKGNLEPELSFLQSLSETDSREDLVIKLFVEVREEQ